MYRALRCDDAHRTGSPGQPKATPEQPTHGGSRPGAGRPAARGATRGEVIRLRVTEADKAEILAARLAADRDLSEVALELLLAWARRSSQVA
jgi:hypothetical protein